MFGVIVTHGKTIEEALQKAAEQLKVPKEQVDYEVIDKGRRGILWARPAVIQATVKEQEQDIKEKQEALNESEQENSAPVISRTGLEPIPENKASAEAPEGTVWVKNGKIYCRNGIYHYPLLSSSEGLTLRINGQSVAGTAVVSEEDQIEVELHKEIVESEVSLTVTEDKMQVILQIIPGHYTIRHLKDQAPNRELVLEATATTIVKTDVSDYMIYEKLKELGVKNGIDHDAVQRASSSQEPITCVVAKGTDPIPGQDGRFEFFQQRLKEERDQFAISDTMDWKDRFSLPTVKTGEVIGSSLPAKPGVSGWDVYGEEVRSSEVKELTVMTLEGTTVYGTNQKVVATRSGRLKIEQRANNTLCFSILPQYVHNGNVNIRTGNIKFHGDLFIIGDVEEGMSVEAGGNLHITGTVTNATVRTGGDAVINGAVIGSAVSCGHSNLFWDDMMTMFKVIREDLTGLIGAAKQLELNRSFSKSDIGKKGLQPMLRLLAEVKYKELPNRIRKISRVLKNEKPQISAETYQAIDFLEKTFLYYHPLITDIKQLEALVSYMDQVISTAKNDLNKKMNIKVQSLTNSSIQSAWDVVVERFCYGSDVYCKGGMKVSETLRGGKIQAGSYVKASEIGSNGSRTEVTIKSKEGYVQASVAWSDTLIKISGAAKKLINQENSIRARLNDQNQIVMR